MKRFVILTAAALILASCTPKQEGYSIKVTVSGENEALKSGKAYISNRDKKYPIRDTTNLVNGRFTFNGMVQTPELFMISIEGIEGVIPLFLENDKYTVTAVDSLLLDATITGGATQSLLNSITDKKNELLKKYDLQRLMDEYNTGTISDERAAEIDEIYYKYDFEKEEFKKKVLAENPLSYYSLDQFSYEAEFMPADSAQTILDKYKAKKEFTGNRVIGYIQNTININKRLALGNPAPDFTMSDPDGKEINFSDIYKSNEVTMIDFWASWCGICCEIKPMIVEAYSQFHKKGFEILGVSFDFDRDSWLNAISKFQLVWPQASDVKFWECEPANLYDVTYIPQNIFVDQNGNIIGRKISEQDIIPFLEEHLK